MTVTDVRDLNSIVRNANQKFHDAKEELGKAVVGQVNLLDRLLMALLTDGHLLLEGLPGLAKTLAVNSLAKVIGCEFKRIQFTPDLLPADLIGTRIYNAKESSFSIQKGPIFTNIVLADEINRAPAKVQSALLEVMAERQITIGCETFYTSSPFLVLATQNPIELEGTYPLPEAQTDRFMMKVCIDYPHRDEEKEILKKNSPLAKAPEIRSLLTVEDIMAARKVVEDIYVDEKVTNYLLDIIFATRNPKKYGVDINRMLDFGASPRASIAFVAAAKAHAFLDGRGFVTPHDIKSIGHDVLRHRLRISYEAEAEEISADDIIDRLFDTILVP